jgi:hypothetical protein
MNDLFILTYWQSSSANKLLDVCLASLFQIFMLTING